MLAALGGAGSTYLGALTAQDHREITTARHETGRQAAQLRTVHVQRNAAGHHLDVFFTQAGAGAMVAGGGASVAGVDTVLEISVIHNFSSAE
ncbi:hypothetical protein IFT83_11045 [Massilia sp. CFBP 13647]|nr:hypothetical protein [Massilia sp. CFBP 13721]MBD8530511.1 hypothetical protein [Massilia sp. CFBP 13647]MBD8674191.1 hypothetical protein [Massilia sp. CFBP 13721]